VYFLDGLVLFGYCYLFVYFLFFFLGARDHVQLNLLYYRILQVSLLLCGYIQETALV
jgi:hypothetical protein